MVGKVTEAALDFVRSQYGRYSPVELGGSVGGVLTGDQSLTKGC